MFKESDINNFIKQLTTSLEKVHENTIHAVEEYLKSVEAVSQSYVPIDSGDLRDSFFTDVEVITSNRRGKITGIAGYDKEGRLVDVNGFNYAKMMHEGIWPSSYPNKKIAGTNIRYKVDHQPTPSSHFLERGFRETGETELARLLKGIFNGV